MRKGESVCSRMEIRSHDFLTGGLILVVNISCREKQIGCLYFQ